MPLQQQIAGRIHSLGGGFDVQRVLPAPQLRSVGPFVFFDYFGPVTVAPEADHDVRPHPHIGLATLTYLLDGAVMHRDNLGHAQEITPGAINWMSAGKGIVHSERRPERLRGQSYTNHGFQLWIALPEAFEQSEPGFVHTPASAIPALSEQGVELRVLVGEAFGLRSPMQGVSPTTMLDLRLPVGGSLHLPPLAQELAVFAVDAGLQVDGADLAPHTLGLLAAGQASRLQARDGGRVLVLGGQPLGHRLLWWNFVATRKELIEQAALDWQQQRMAPVPGDPERIDLPATTLPG